MGQHNVRVTQLHAQSYGNSKVNRAFLNVRDDDYGSISVLTITSLPTYLVGNDYTIELIQFNDDRWAADWFTRHQNYILWVKHARYVDKEQGVVLTDVDLSTLLIDRDDDMCPPILGEEGPRPIDVLSDLVHDLVIKTSDYDALGMLGEIQGIISDLGGHRVIR